MADSVVKAVFETAEKEPGKLCLADDAGSRTYGEYTRLLLRDARALQELGVQRGDRVVVEGDQTVEFLATQLALHLVGAIFVPVERNCTPVKIRNVANLVDASYVITLKREIEGVKNSVLMQDFMKRSADVDLSSDKLPENAPGTALEAAAAAGFTFPDKDDVSDILFSTGTTGTEKGIMLSFDANMATAENVAIGVGIQHDNVELILSPFNHSHGLRRLYADIYAGASVIMQSSVMDMKTLFYNLEHYQVNAMDLVPAALSVVLKLSKDRLGEYRDQFRFIQLGSAPIRSEDQEHLKRLFPGIPLYNTYGSTEGGSITVQNFNVPNPKSGSIGKAAINTEIVIVDDDGHEIQSDPGHTGHLASRGRAGMKGYWNDPVETARVLKGDLVVSSDIAYIDEEKEIILIGRQGDVINTGGKKVSPLEVEAAASKIDGVADAGCVGIPDEMRGEVPVLFVQMKGGAEFDGVAIRSALQQTLEPFKVPARIVKVSKIPRTFKGSMQRGKLREMLE